jgi:hypothetical protein
MVADAAPAGRGWARRGYTVLAWIFVACLAVQTFLAGQAVFTGPELWPLHTSFVHVFELLPVVMLVLAVVGRLPRGLRWLPVLVFALLALQYATAAMGKSLDLKPFGAIHPVNALLMFWLAIHIAQRSQRSLGGTAA